ncbi:MAG: MarR family winged helix-turn-helix transcriptional regulator [Blastocatellia bacterium]
MGEKLAKRLKESRFESPLQEAILNLMVTADYLRRHTETICAEFDITRAQYNVLRILRGVYPEGHPRCEVAQRMVEHAPDVTRLIDRLESQGLVERDRSGDDRRLSLTRITRKGLDLIKRMEPAMSELSAAVQKRISRQELVELSRICEKIYEDDA